MTDPRWIEMERRAVELRRQGLTYEEIAKAVSGDRYAATPWWVYGQCNAERRALRSSLGAESITPNL